MKPIEMVEISPRVWVSKAEAKEAEKRRQKRQDQIDDLVIRYGGLAFLIAKVAPCLIAGLAGV